MTPREPLSRQRAPENAQMCLASREKDPLAHKPTQLLSSEEGAKLRKARFQGSRAQVACVQAGLERSCLGGRRRGVGLLGNPRGRGTGGGPGAGEGTRASRSTPAAGRGTRHPLLPGPPTTSLRVKAAGPQSGQQTPSVPKRAQGLGLCACTEVLLPEDVFKRSPFYGDIAPLA